MRKRNKEKNEKQGREERILGGKKEEKACRGVKEEERFRRGERRKIGR